MGSVDQFAIRTGIPAVLAQHGVDDTMVDLLFNLVDAFVTAVWGTVYLADVVDSMSERFEEWWDE